MAVVITAGAVDLDREGRDPAYVESIVKLSLIHISEPTRPY